MATNITYPSSFLLIKYGDKYAFLIQNSKKTGSTSTHGNHESNRRGHKWSSQKEDRFDRDRKSSLRTVCFKILDKTENCA
uniref:Uncharacterized protein n=1 Tax=Magallana gigas TaxID=29159 RepID=K1Q845_MAGGI